MASDGFKINELPVHRGQALTAEQMRALGPITVQENSPAEGFVTLLLPQEGSYTLYPEHMNGDDPMCQIKSRVGVLDMKQAFAMGTLEDPDAEARRWQVISGADLGSVWSQRMAIDLLTALHDRPFDLTVEGQLADAGFVQSNGNPEVWYKTTNSGSFSYFDKPECGWLTFEKRNARHWHNLVLLNYFTAWQDGEHAFPIYWPSTVADPRRAAAGLAVLATQLWTPDLLPQRGRKRAPGT